MLWEVEIQPSDNQIDREAARVLAESDALGADSLRTVRSSRSFLIEGNLDRSVIERVATDLLADTLVERISLHDLSESETQQNGNDACHLLNVLLKPGVTDNVAGSETVNVALSVANAFAVASTTVPSELTNVT